MACILSRYKRSIFCTRFRIMLTISEVVKMGNAAKVRLGILLGGLFFFAATALAEESAKDTGHKELGRELGDCNWQVTYRGRQYDLSPLTREALSRPIENDIRFAIQRVPEAAERLDTMTGLLRSARAHTLIATAFLGAFALFKVLESNQNNRGQREDYRTASWASAGFFLGATFFSWKSTREAKDELVKAVEDFNAHSPHKILPANQGLDLSK